MLTKNEMFNKFGYLTKDACERIFETENSSVQLLLYKIRKSELLWLNRRAMKLDPAFYELACDEERYGQHIINSCSYVLDATRGKRIKGWADRYGGRGTGTSGGSGRAGFINGYHVKGIGRTPLVGKRMDPAHSSGTLSLADAILETIYSEAMAEFPWSSVPTIAILDTGLLYKRDESLGWSGPTLERCVLIVRPAVLRVAHFERATWSVLEEIKTGEKDAQRVRHMISSCFQFMNSNDFLQRIKEFFVRWSEQMAFGLLNRISQYNFSTSNVSLDGKLLDFGGARSIFRRENIRASGRLLPYGPEFDVLISSIGSIRENLFRYGGMSLQTTEVLEAALDAYNNQFVVSFLVNAGVDSLLISQLYSDGSLKRIKEMILGDQKLIGEFKRALCPPKESYEEAGQEAILDRKFFCSIERIFNCIKAVLNLPDSSISSARSLYRPPLSIVRQIAISKISEVISEISLNPDYKGEKIDELITADFFPDNYRPS